MCAFILIVGIASAEDLTWTQANASAFPARYDHASCEFDSKIWVSGGYNGTAYLNDVWYSSDGETWTCANASPAFDGRAGHAMLSLGSYMYVIGGYDGEAQTNNTYAAKYDVYRSSDGISWTLLTNNPAFRSNYTYYGGLDSYGLAYMANTVGENKLWLAGGYAYKDHSGYTVLGNDVWYSTDGSTWTDGGNCPSYMYNLYTSTGWERSEIEWMSVAFIGGKFDTAMVTSPILPTAGTAYTSLDSGATWDTRTTAGFWDPRSDFGLAYYDSKLILMGGYGTTYLRDVWYSDDEGETWSEFSDGSWSARRGLVATEFDDKVFITGGYDASTGALSDVWYGEMNTTATSPSESDTNSGAGIQYPPHTVRVQILTGFGSPLTNATITATPVETSMGSWSWLSDLFGIDNDVNIAGSTLTGKTGMDGAVSFLLSESIQYRINVTHSDISDYSVLLYPKDGEYIFFVDTFDWFTGGEDVNSLIYMNVTTAAINATYQGITVVGNATDTTGFTGGTVYLNQTNTTVPNGPETTIATYVIPAAVNFSHTFNVTDYAGDSYFIRVEATHDSYGAYEKDFGVTFPVDQVNPMGLDNFQLMWISAIILLVVGSIFTASTAHQGPLLTCFVGWILYGIGWMNLLGGVLAVGLLTAATVLSVFIVIAARKEAR